MTVNVKIVIMQHLWCYVCFVCVFVVVVVVVFVVVVCLFVCLFVVVVVCFFVVFFLGGGGGRGGGGNRLLLNIHKGYFSVVTPSSGCLTLRLFDRGSLWPSLKISIRSTETCRETREPALCRNWTTNARNANDFKIPPPLPPFNVFPSHK